MTDMSTVHEFFHVLFFGWSCKSSTGARGFFAGAGVFVAGAGGAKTRVFPPLVWIHSFKVDDLSNRAPSPLGHVTLTTSLIA